MKLQEFLEEVVTSNDGWFNLSHSKGDGSAWAEEWFKYPTEIGRITDRINSLSDYNVYFSPYLFSEPKSTRESAIVGRTVVADLDFANVLTLRYKPTVLVETSNGRHQGYWVLETPLDAAQHEAYSKRLTYSIQGCDKSGWWISHKFRVPETNNYKYAEDNKVQVVAYTGRKLRLSELDQLPEVPPKNGVDYDMNFQAFFEKAMKTSSGPQEFLHSIQGKLPPKVVTQYNVEVEDRSAALWALMCAGFRAGLNTEQVFFLARSSCNNKFTSLRFHGDQELLKDVLRAKAETYGSHNKTNLREKIDTIRRYNSPNHEKMRYIADQIRADMVSTGQFINCGDGTSWYIDNNDGRPIPIVKYSETLQTFFDSRYGLNPTERETSYVTGALITHVNSLMAIGKLGSMSYYDEDTKSVLLHTGRKDVLRITTKDITTVTDGYDSIVFPWSPAQEVISPYFKHSGKAWEDILFDRAFDTVTGLTKNEAKALLKVWLLMLLLRDGIISRPILAIFGQPGAGKSTLFRRIYTLLYGRGRTLAGITTADNFDFATASDPLVVFDNVDTWEKWLPDRLALAAAASEITKRKLYTNNEVVTLKRQAFLGITAHNPKFGREDVADRLVILTLERLKEFRSETVILNYIHEYRSAIWGMIIQDLQKILAHPIPTTGFPQFRIEDFSKYGMWIAQAAGYEQEFFSAVEKIAGDQKSFNLEEDQPLIETLTAYCKHPKVDLDEYMPASHWFPRLAALSSDEQEFKKAYKNAVILGKKFWTIQDTLKALFTVEWAYNKKIQARTWRFKLLTDEVNT